MQCMHIAVSIPPLLGINCVSFYRSGLTSILPVVYRLLSMPLLLACWCHSRSMRHCFLGRWTCLLVSVNYHLLWRCHLFDWRFSGDRNAQIGKNVNDKFILHNSSNRNGEHRTDFTRENRLKCLNTKFQKRKPKLWTNTYAKNTEAQIDDVSINKKWNNSEWNCEA